MKVPCPECKTMVTIDWLHPLEFPRFPIEPDGGGGHWVPVSIPIDCTNQSCAKRFDFEIEKTPDAKPFAFYGDEASREQGQRYLLVYALVGANKSVREAIISKLRDAKLQLLPNMDPDQWVLHMKELWSGHERLRKSRFAHLKRTDIEQMVSSISTMLRVSYPDFFRSVFSTVIHLPAAKRDRRTAMNRARDESFSSLVWLTMDLTRKQGIKPEFYFDATQTLQSHPAIEGWVGNLFLGAQYTRLHTYLSAGRTILPPKALKPGSDPMLEVADFLAFVAARWLSRRIANQATDVDLAATGPAFFAGFDRKGDVRFQWADVYPFDLFFGQ